MMGSSIDGKERANREGETFLRRFVISEEDRPLFTSSTWAKTGGYRWFRSPNVVCLEHYRGKAKKRELNGGQ
jgi:hypothetical protein